MITVRVHGVVVEPATRGFAVILIDDNTKKWLPIFIGPFEAKAIADELDNVKPPRPLTHDLMKNLLDSLGAKVLKIGITDLRDSTFYATVNLELNSAKMEIDARPSDAIALALRTKSPILVAEEIMEKAGQESLPQEHHEDEKTKKINELRMKLHASIENENFEDAARVRDELRKLIHPVLEKKLKALRNKLDEALKNENIDEISKLKHEIQKLEAQEKQDDTAENK